MKFKQQKIFGLRLWAFGCVAASMCSLPAGAASLSLYFHNSSNEPVAQVIAALIPLAKSAPQPQPTAIMDQRNNAFVPGVLAIRTNTLVHFPNSDNVRHHVYSFSSAKRFELRLYHGQTAQPILFDQPGTVVLGCNIHDSMIGYIYVVDSEHYGVADAEGKLVIENIPAGEYQLELQHPELKDNAPAAETLNFAVDDNKMLNIVVPDIQATGVSEQPESELKKLFKRT